MPQSDTSKAAHRTHSSGVGRVVASAFGQSLIGACVFAGTLAYVTPGSMEALAGLGIGVGLCLGSVLSLMSAAKRARPATSPVAPSSGIPSAQIAELSDQLARQHAEQQTVFKTNHSNLVKISEHQVLTANRYQSAHTELDEKVDKINDGLVRLGSIVGDLTRITRETLASTQQKWADTAAPSVNLEPVTSALAGLQRDIVDLRSEAHDHAARSAELLARQPQNEPTLASDGTNEAVAIARAADHMASIVEANLSGFKGDAVDALAAQFSHAAGPLLAELQSLRAHVDAILSDLARDESDDESGQDRSDRVAEAAQFDDLTETLKASLEAALKEHEAIVIGRLSQLSIQLTDARRADKSTPIQTDYLGSHARSDDRKTALKEADRLSVFTKSDLPTSTMAKLASPEGPTSTAVSSFDDPIDEDLLLKDITPLKVPDDQMSLRKTVAPSTSELERDPVTTETAPEIAPEIASEIAPEDAMSDRSSVAEQSASQDELKSVADDPLDQVGSEVVEAAALMEGSSVTEDLAINSLDDEAPVVEAVPSEETRSDADVFEEALSSSVKIGAPKTEADQDFEDALTRQLKALMPEIKAQARPEDRIERSVNALRSILPAANHAEDADALSLNNIDDGAETDGAGDEAKALLKSA